MKGGNHKDVEGVHSYDIGMPGCLFEIPIVHGIAPTLLEAYEHLSQNIIGRDDEKKKIIKKILDLGVVPGPSVLAVIGKGGIGKTALVKQVYKDVAKGYFDIKLWVSDWSELDFSISRILKGIIESATGEITSTECKQELVDKIKFALNDKRYFLVLDDVGLKNNPIWVELKSILDVGKTGSVILITARRLEIAFSAQCVEFYCLEPLSDFDCWSIFIRFAFSEGEEERYPRLVKIGRSIVRQCSGVPLVAVCLGNLLRSERDKREWIRIDKMDINLEKDSDIPFLRLAYDKLPSHLKLCFAYFALTLGDIRGVRPHLIFFWSALGLLQLRDANDDIEKCGQNYLVELLSRFIINDYVWTFSRRIVSFKIQGILYDLAMEVLGEFVAVISCNDIRVSDLSRHIIWGNDQLDALSNKEFPQELLEAKRVRTFIFGYRMGRVSQSFIEGIICNLSYLYILDLGFTHFEELPTSIGNLMHLKVLNMSYNSVIKSLPDTICELLNLQAFNLEGCEQLQELPKKVSRLISLKCFIVTTCQRSLVGSEFSNLPSLQELQFISCKGLVSLWEEGDIGRLISLRRLHFHDCPQLARLPNSMRLLVDLEELVIANCQLLDLEEGEGFSGLISLQSLEISGVQRLTCLPPGIQSAASSLEYFILRDCVGLVELPNWLQSFGHLHSFIIYNCPNLRKGLCHRIKSLKELKIKGCPYLSRWCETPDGFSHIEHIAHIEIDGHLITHKMKKEPSSSCSVIMPESGAHEISLSSKIRKEMKLLFSLFPNDYEFERETLVQLWLAAGHFKTGLMEESARRYFDSFLKEGYILLSGIDNFSGVCKYIINADKVVKVSSNGLYTLFKDEVTKGNGTEHRHISVVCSHVNPSTFETLSGFTELRTIMFIRNYGHSLKQVPSDMFLVLKYLETLDLSGSHIKELPGSIGNATQLRYLDLSFTLIESMPETINRLLELQTLKLKGCKKLYNLPKGMKKLISLRHLYFDVLGQLSFMPKGIGALIELRTLSAFIVDDEEGCNIRELRNMNNLSGSCCISGLENVSYTDSWEPVLLDKMYLTQIQLRWVEYGTTDKDNNVLLPVSFLEPHSCLEKLEVFCYPNSRLPRWICNEKFQHLTSITFLKCENSKLDICLGQLPNLKYLDIIQMNRVERIDCFIHAGIGYVSFPKLERLTIDGMYSLASWTGVTSDDFPLLSEFNMKYCPNIRLLPFLAYLGSLKHLEISHCIALRFLSGKNLSEKLTTLVIDGCPLLRGKCSMEGEYWDKIKHVPEIWVDLDNMQSPSKDDSEDAEEDESCMFYDERAETSKRSGKPAQRFWSSLSRRNNNNNNSKTYSL